MGQRRLVLSAQALAASVPNPAGAGAATLPAIGESVTYRALHENGGDLRATVIGRHSRGGLNIDVHIPGATDPLTLTNVPFLSIGGVRGSCFL